MPIALLFPTRLCKSKQCHVAFRESTRSDGTSLDGGPMARAQEFKSHASGDECRPKAPRFARESPDTDTGPVSREMTRYPISRLMGAGLGTFLLTGLGGCIGSSCGKQEIQGMVFGLSAPPGSQGVVAGGGAGFTVSVAPPAVIGAVTLGVTGLPAGVEAAFSPGFEINGSRTLNVFTTTTTPSGTSHLTITATASGITRTTTANLTITPAADFMMSVTPNSHTIKPGMSTNYNVNVIFTGSTTGPVNLRITGLPPTATASFDRNPITASGTVVLTVTADPQIVTVIAPLNVIGSDSAGTIQVPIAFSIIPADFSLIQTVGPVEVNAGGTVTGQILVVGLFATPGTVNL